jgi:flagellar capping protein FliD
MALEKKPLNSLKAQKTSLNSSLTIYSDLKTKISALLSAAEELKSTSTSSIYNSRTSSSSASTEVDATADTNAATGAFQVRVKQLATGASIQSTAQVITKPATISSSKVAPGSGTIDVAASFASAGFGSTPTGTVTIGDGVTSTTFTLSAYSTVQAFMDAVNNDATANANIYYDKTVDKFYLESKNATARTFTESEAAGGAGFFTQVKMRSSGGTYGVTTDATGIQTDVVLSKANLDTAISGTGSFKINGISISWDASTDTLSTVISNINKSTANVNAYYDTSLDKVVIKSKNTGSTDTITLSDVSGSLLSSLNLSGATQTNGQDAKLTINSTSSGDEITKSSNTFTINGVKYNLKKTNVTAYTDTTYTTITVSQDTSAIQSKISSFLDKFNDVTGYIQSKSSVDIDSKKRGPLAGNSTFVSLRRQLIQKLSGQVTGLTSGDPDYLNEIGITFDSNLKASLSDTSKFNSAITSSSKAVENLFNSTNGVANKIYDLIKPYVKTTGSSTNSIIDATTNVINNRITGIDDSITRMEERLALREKQYSQQLYQMQGLLNDLVLQGNQITTMTNTINNNMSLF